MKKKIVNPFTSEAFQNDYEAELFEISDEDKREYYRYDIYIDSDFISLKGKTERDISIVCIGDEILVKEACDLTDQERLMIERFYNKGFENHFQSLWVGTNIHYKDDKRYKEGYPILWYRGGSGYHFYCHQYKYKLTERSVIGEYREQRRIK